jgi:hypothetical protein
VTFSPPTTVFVDAEAGSDDAGTGSRTSPLRSLALALLRSRQLRRGSERVTIALQPGTLRPSAAETSSNQPSCIFYVYNP